MTTAQTITAVAATVVNGTTYIVDQAGTRWPVPPAGLSVYLPGGATHQDMRASSQAVRLATAPTPLTYTSRPGELPIVDAGDDGGAIWAVVEFGVAGTTAAQLFPFPQPLPAASVPDAWASIPAEIQTLLEWVAGCGEGVVGY